MKYKDHLSRTKGVMKFGMISVTYVH